MTATELRELDAWIAEHVMEYIRTETPDIWTKHDKTLFWIRKESGREKAGVFIGQPYQPHNVEEYSHEWIRFAPTTEPAAVMEVLKKCGQMEIRGTSFVCASFSNGNNSTMSTKGHWHVGRLDGDGRWVAGEGDNALTLELAICLFAKKLFSK